jgi:glycerophosphoryl diester phosphodiesterase
MKMSVASFPVSWQAKNRLLIMSLRISLYVVLLMALSKSGLALEPTPAQKLVAQPGPLIIAHRGDSAHAPENTLSSFASAVKLKADLVELDYYHSKEGIPVVIHDNFLDRTTDSEAIFGSARVLVEETPLADLQKLDAGAWFDPKFKGTKLPTLAESLDLIQAGSVTLIERKKGDAATCIKLLREKKLVDQVVVQSFDWKYVRDCHELEPTLVLAVLGGGKDALSDARLDAAAATGASIVAWDHAKLTKTQIVAIHARGLKAWCYTVDDSARALELAAAGIDGIITNVPGKMIKVVRAK